MSVQSISWVLEDCPDLLKHLVATLMGLANHADRNGKGAYPSQETLSWYTRKDERSVRRDLEQLEELKLITKGDQRMVLHLPADKRPVVWNLAMDRKRDPRPEPGKPGRPRKEQENEGASVSTGNTPEKRGDADVRADADVKNGGTPTSKPQDADVPRTVLEPPLEPSVPSERPPASSETVQPMLTGEVQQPREPDLKDQAFGIARQHLDKLAEQGAPAPEEDLHKLKSGLVKYLRTGYSATEISEALTRLGDPVPSSPSMYRTLKTIRSGRAGTGGRYGGRSAVVDVNEAWADEAPQYARAASAGGVW